MNAPARPSHTVSASSFRSPKRMREGMLDVLHLPCAALCGAVLHRWEADLGAEVPPHTLRSAVRRISGYRQTSVG